MTGYRSKNYRINVAEGLNQYNKSERSETLGTLILGLHLSSRSTASEIHIHYLSIRKVETNNYECFLQFSRRKNWSTEQIDDLKNKLSASNFIFITIKNIKDDMSKIFSKSADSSSFVYQSETAPPLLNRSERRTKGFKDKEKNLYEI